MKAKPYKLEGSTYKPCAPQVATHVCIHTPGPFCNRFIPIIQSGSRRDHQGPVWSWNGDTEKPTLKPSVLTRTEDWSSGECIKIVCHTWINDGKVQFLSDCSHEFAGQTLDLLDVE